MYKLTLTKAEREAIDFVGRRYFHGYELFNILTDNSEVPWDSDGDITYELPEHVAWEINDGLEAEAFELGLFDDRLRSKLIVFCGDIT